MNLTKTINKFKFSKGVSHKFLALGMDGGA